MSVTLSSAQSARLGWITAQLQKLDPNQAVSVAFATEDVNNQGGVYQVRSVSWIRGTDHYTEDLDASTSNCNMVSVALVNATQALTHVTTGVPWIQYQEPGEQPPVKDLPPDTIVPGPVTVENGRNYRTDTRMADGKTRKMEQGFGALWVPLEDWK